MGLRFPLPMTLTIAGYLARKRLTKAKRFPMVLMLEPLHACNLTCTGCGRIREYEATIKQKLSVEECLASVDECPAPVVSICGGEPLIYPGIGELTAKILERGRNVYLCTNGVYLRKKLGEFKPSSRFFFNVHLDGLRESHDNAVERPGVFDQAVEGIQAAKEAGFLVCTNTTVYKETDMGELEQLFAFLTERGVDGFIISPAYEYSAVQSKDIFLTRDMIQQKFRAAEAMFKKYKFSELAHLSRIPDGQARDAMHGLGQPHAQHPGLEGPLLPDHRRPSPELRRPARRGPPGSATGTATIRVARIAWFTPATR